LIATIRTTAMAAPSIAKEKEARTLPILLGTLLEPWQIVRGKALTVLWRNTPAWLILALSKLVFYILMLSLQRTTGDSGPGYRYYYIIIGPFGVAAYVVFLIGIGMYFSVRLKSSTAAVMAAIGSVLGLYVMQMFSPLLFYGILARRAYFEFVQILSLFSPILFHTVVGLLFLRQAKCRLKRNIF